MTRTIDMATPDALRSRRSKFEARRLEILKAAKGVFLDHGYEMGTMSEVARRLGGSKGTLYRYFESKDALFAAVVKEAAASRTQGIIGGFFESDDLASDLVQFGRAVLTSAMSGEHIALYRALIAEAGKSDLGKLYFACELGVWGALARRLAKAMEQGLLRRARPWAAATHFRVLCQADLHSMRLEGMLATISPAEVATAVDDAVEVFLHAYATRRYRSVKATQGTRLPATRR